MIRITFLVCLAFLAAPAFASNMTKVKDAPGCSKEGEGECVEWRIEGVPWLRLINHGFEDGTDTTFYRVDKDGKYTPILDVIPVVRDKRGLDNWSFADLASLVFERGPNGPFIWATFDHDVWEAGVACHPKWERRVPAVLFRGPWSSDAGSEQTRYRYRRISLSELIAQARESSDNWKSRMVCNSNCCQVDQPGASQQRP